MLGLDAKGVAMLGSIAAAAPRLSLPMISLDELYIVAPLAVLIALVVMVQTAATTRAFPNSADGPDVNRDFIGIGAANAFSGFIGAFPVDASPPSPTVAAEAGCASQVASLVSAAVATGVLLFAGQALAHVPSAALAGVLLFVAMRLVHVGVMRDVWTRSRAEFLADPCDCPSDSGAADRSRAWPRRAPVGAPWRVDDDACPGGGIGAHPRHVDLVASRQGDAKANSLRACG